jgi:hypothetical protein
MWWILGASQGDEYAQESLKKVEMNMTAAQIEKAQKLANECVAKNYKDC